MAPGNIGRGFMSMDLFDRLLVQLRSFRPLVAINLGGESTLHRRLPEMIAALHDSGCYVFLDTNATLLTDKVCDELIDAQLDELVLCLDGNGDADSYAAIRVRGDFDVTVQNIRRFLAIRQRRESTMPLTIVKNIQHYSQHRPLSFPTELKSLFDDAPPDEYRATWADYWPGTHADDLRQDYEVEPYSPGDYQPCSNLWKKLAISWDGMVYACCLDLNRTTPVGDLRSSTIRQVWNSNEMRRLRHMHRRNEQDELDLCRNCTMIQRSPSTATAGLVQLRTERFTRWVDERT